MVGEMDAIQPNDTCVLVERPDEKKIIGLKQDKV